MQTGQSGGHSPIGSFQRTCYVVSAPVANGPPAAEHGEPLRDGTTATQPAITWEAPSTGVTPLAHGQRPRHLRLLLLTHLGAMTVAAGHPPAARMMHDCLSDHVRSARSASHR